MNIKQRFTLDVDFARSVFFRSGLQYDWESMSQREMFELTPDLVNELRLAQWAMEDQADLKVFLKDRNSGDSVNTGVSEEFEYLEAIDDLYTGFII